MINNLLKFRRFDQGDSNFLLQIDLLERLFFYKKQNLRLIDDVDFVFVVAFGKTKSLSL